jgi:hypothetical protein
MPLPNTKECKRLRLTEARHRLSMPRNRLKAHLFVVAVLDPALPSQ